jgi:hypothetical protein
VTCPRFHKNPPGPFYTTGECLACTMPEAVAPSLLAEINDDNGDTYFMRQPETPEEVDLACRAAFVCCVGSIRYGGHDSNIIRRLGNRGEYCDHLLSGGPVRVPEDNDVRWRSVIWQYRLRRWRFWK